MSLFTRKQYKFLDRLFYNSQRLQKAVDELRSTAVVSAEQSADPTARQAVEIVAPVPEAMGYKDPEYRKVMDRGKAHIQVTVTTLDDAFCRTYEKASLPSERIRAIQTLQAEGFDVAIRMSPYIPQFWLGSLYKLKEYGINKALVEFLRVNAWIRRWFDIDYTEYTLRHGGYDHLPLELKKQYIQPILGLFKEVTVCEDEDEAYEYWKNNVNPNPDDCCNLRRTMGGDEDVGSFPQTKKVHR